MIGQIAARRAIIRRELAQVIIDERGRSRLIGRHGLGSSL
jgi:hypothetical protein